MWFKVNETVAAQRRFPVYLVQTDGLTPATGEAGGQPQFSKNGGTFGNTASTLTAVGNGFYYVELSQANLDTAGWICVRYKGAPTAEFNLTLPVRPVDSYDAVRMGLTALPNANAEAAGGLYTRGTGAGQINQQTNGQVDVNLERWVNVAPLGLNAQRVQTLVNALAAGSITVTEAPNLDAAITTRATPAQVNAEVDAALDTAIPTTPTADSVNERLKRLEEDVTPTRAANLDNLDAAVTSRLAPTTAGRTLDVAVGGEAGLDLDNTVGTLSAAEVPNLDAAVSSRATPAQVNAEVLDVLGTDTQTLPGQAAPPLTPTLIQAITWLYKLMRNRRTQDATDFKVYADDETTVDHKAAVTTSAGVTSVAELQSGP